MLVMDSFNQMEVNNSFKQFQWGQFEMLRIAGFVADLIIVDLDIVDLLWFQNYHISSQVYVFLSLPTNSHAL